MSTRRRALAAGLLVATAGLACHHDDPPPAGDTTAASSDDGGEDTEAPPSGPPRPERAEVQTCRFEGWAPGLLPPLAFEATAVPPISGARSLALGDGVLLVGTDDGALWGIDPSDEAEPLRALLPGDGSPITGLARGPSNGLDALFVRIQTEAPARTRVIRYTLQGPRTLDAASALDTVVVDFSDAARQGAGLLAADGLLWVPLGDGEAGDEAGASDNPNQREGNLLRLDVSTLSSPSGYDLPADNPLAGQPSPAAEAWAWGLRDPTSCTLDPTRDRVWCLDRGAAISEASLVPAASNLGWPRLEGSSCQLPGGCDGLDTQLPLATYRHGADDCGVGPGAVADGMDPELDGAIVYADRCSGRLMAARPLTAEQPSARTVVGQLDPALVALAADPAGGLWALDAVGQLGRLVVERPPGEFPTALTRSGCFEGTGVQSPAPDLIPYSINAPLWTDGSHKERYLVIPPGQQLSVEPDGRLRFPVGSIIVKNFSYPLDLLEPDQLTPVETRVMIRRSYTWEFHSYRWNEAGTEATLLDDGQSQPMLTALDGAPTVVRHTFPSRDECGYCHDNGDVRALGPRLDQLARQVEYLEGPDDQLQVFEAIGLFDAPLPPSEPMADYLDPEASDEARARAYLHANCGHCHRPGGWTPPDLDMDLRWTTPTPEANLCGVPPQYSSTFPADHRVAPGDPSDSLVWLRLSSRGPWQMPPFATSVPDPAGSVVRTWIEGLDGCP
ncbi:MAG: PQQ-dependent sugar dehydrogenase [Myxococcales bacterium]|nr:PQQ-dependent sugar dehydrogenase [Myxococcales bacterium]